METVPQPPQRSYTTVFIVILLLLSATIASVYLYMRTSHKKNNEDLSSITPTKIENSPTQILATVSPSKAVEKVDLETIKTEIKNNTNPPMIAELIDISPDNSQIAYLGHDEKWTKYGVYMYSRSDKQIKTIYEANEDISGRGGIFNDNADLKYSPSGEAFYVNKTGINFPSLFIVNNKGDILYKADKAWGHPTWLSGTKLIFLGETNTKPLAYDITTKSTSETSLPENIFHLKANPSGTRIVAYTVANSQFKCETFDLHIYAYPEGTELKMIPNTELMNNGWITSNTFSFQKVVDCKKNEGEAMFPYSAVSEEQTITVN